MSFARRHPIWLTAVAGVAIRLFLAFHFYGSGDLLGFQIVADRAASDHSHVYAGNLTSPFGWFYPPTYLLWLLGARELTSLTDWPFHAVVQLLPTFGDLALGLAVYVYLGWRDFGERSRVAGFALVLLGPVFIAISGYHGQIDSIAILPGLLALMIWERGRGPARPLGAGGLVGLGSTIKTPPSLLVLPLLASARSLKEGARLVGAAAAVALLICLPFYLAEPEGFRKAISYAGLPSRGGLSLVADPGFAADRRQSGLLALTGHPNGAASWLSDHGALLTAVALILLAFLLFRYRPAAIDGIVLLWLAVFVVSPNFLLQYLVWFLPFAIMAGYLWEVAALQVALIAPLVITYLDPSATSGAIAAVYVVMMICLWVFWVLALTILARRIISSRASHPVGVQPPLRARSSTS